MKYIKALGLVTTALAALMAFAGMAAATTVTSTAGSTPSFTAESEGSVTLTSSFFVTIHCSRSHFAGSITSHGAGIPASGPVSSLSFSECTDPMTTKTGGSLTMSSTGTTGNGTLSSSGIQVTIHTSVGECVIATSNTHLGILTGGHGAKLQIKSVSLPIVGGSFFCPSSLVLEGSYKFVQPTELTLH